MRLVASKTSRGFWQYPRRYSSCKVVGTVPTYWFLRTLYSPPLWYLCHLFWPWGNCFKSSFQSGSLPFSQVPHLFWIYFLFRSGWFHKNTLCRAFTLKSQKVQKTTLNERKLILEAPMFQHFPIFSTSMIFPLVSQIFGWGVLGHQPFSSTLHRTAFASCWSLARAARQLSCENLWNARVGREVEGGWGGVWTIYTPEI